MEVGVRPIPTPAAAATTVQKKNGPCRQQSGRGGGGELRQLLPPKPPPERLLDFFSNTFLPFILAKCICSAAVQLGLCKAAF